MPINKSKKTKNKTKVNIKLIAKIKKSLIIIKKLIEKYLKKIIKLI